MSGPLKLTGRSYMFQEPLPKTYCQCATTSWFRGLTSEDGGPPRKEYGLANRKLGDISLSIDVC
jgi:hypothetical protein